jgi:putative mRNA 3-end processing factor
MKNHTDSFDGLELIDSGHILGSRGLLIDGEVFYTGDISVRDRAFLRGARVPRCKTLILESTYGKPGFVFPSTGEIVDSVNKIISNLYSRGVPAILMGYPLGKAQVLTSLFRHWQPLYLHDSIIEMNNVYQDLGVDLGAGTAYSQAEEDGMLSRKPWIMVAPKTGPRSPFVQQMKDRYGAVTIGFTGWALANWSRFFSGLDYSIPLSDHCDFKELLSIVRACSPSKVYTFHGYAKELASHLTGLGYDAEALVRSNHVLSDYAG